jgi:hypothetical protein
LQRNVDIKWWVDEEGDHVRYSVEGASIQFNWTDDAAVTDLEKHLPELNDHANQMMYDEYAVKIFAEALPDHLGEVE